MNLILIGLRGSGKTTAGREAAAAMSREFVDLDHVTPGLLGCATVREAWDRFGETEFRAAETRALQGVVARKDAVLALGGGTPTAPGAAELLEAAKLEGSGRIVYLRADANALRERLAATDVAQRPGLTPAGTLAEVEEMLAKRDGLYRSLADVVIEVAGLSVRRVADACVAAMGE